MIEKSDLCKQRNKINNDARAISFAESFFMEFSVVTPDPNGLRKVWLEQRPLREVCLLPGSCMGFGDEKRAILSRN